MKHKYLWVLLVLLVACGAGNHHKAPPASAEETAILLEYLEENGNLVNSPYLPALINADDVYNNLHAVNIHIIDLRPANQFAAGHIEHSVNVRPSGILYHFEHVIDPAGFDFIVLVCPNAMLSAYVNSVLLMLGYGNVLTLRYGLSSWDRDIAEVYWLAAMNSELEGQLETQAHPKRPAGELPTIATGYSLGYQILRARAKEILEAGMGSVNADLQDILEHPDRYYQIKYWPEAMYNNGHLPGAIQYTPKASLHSSQYLNTLPLDQPIVLGCYTGHHSAYVTAFLRLLGYEVYNLPYGANSFIHETMRTTQSMLRTFTEEHVHDFPLTGKNPDASTQAPGQEDRPENTPVIGGC